MISILANWWRSYQFSQALRWGNEREAKRLLQEIKNSGAKLSLLEQVFQKKLEADRSIASYKRELASVSVRLQAASRDKNNCLVPDKKFVKFIKKSFKFVEHDDYKLQCTGVEQRIFDDCEANLVRFLEEEFAKISEQRLQTELASAIQDLQGLKIGLDPQYNLKLSPHVYFMTYFLDNVYCTYLAWFLIYQAGLLPENLKILDVAAGPATVAYGLALLLRSSSGFVNISPLHISYYSLEKQSLLQLRGLQFWRNYLESQPATTNAYFRFDTTDIFDYNSESKKIPDNFFDFIVISHCFFYEEELRIQSHKIYKELFQSSLALGGYVLLVVQGKKLFRAYNVPQSEDIEQEQSVINKFLKELGLTLEWYKYLTSTGTRIPIGKGFSKFARENLYEQKYLSILKQKYLEQTFTSNYVIDDYVILAKG